MKPEELKKSDHQRLQAKAKHLINTDPILAEFQNLLSAADQIEPQHLVTSARFHSAATIDHIIISTLLSQQKQISKLIFQRPSNPSSPTGEEHQLQA